MSSKKHLQRSLIPKSASNKSSAETSLIKKDVDQLNVNHLKGSSHNDSRVLISVQLLQEGFECFSDWSKQDMKEFWKFRDKIHDSTWKSVHSTASKGKKKRGFAKTNIDRKQYPKTKLMNSLSKDIELFELRVSKKKRVHGFRLESVFFLCFLDKDHKICP